LPAPPLLIFIICKTSRRANLDNPPLAPGPPTQPAGSDLDRVSVITNRSDLIQTLCDAAQLEHGLCCAYLFAAFSMKRRADEGVAPHRLADLRSWESVLLLIARQEMEHLGIVCNLLTSIGGMPYLQNLTFPIAANRYGDLPQLPLQRFCRETIQRLLSFETPEWVHIADIILGRIQATKNARAALLTACQQICVEMEWAAGDFWEPKEGTFVCLMRVTGGLKISYGPEVGQDLWTRWQTPHAPRGQALKAKQILNSSVVNTYVEIPVYVGTELKGLWRFFYETFRTTDEDDPLAEALEGILSGPNPDSLRDQLLDFPTIPVQTDTGLRGIQARYSTIGGFYRQIRKGFMRLCYRDHQPTGEGLFTGFQTGNPDIGIQDRNVHDMDLPTVSDLDSALAAINEVIETGEACSNKRVASHYVRLRKLLQDYDAVMAQTANFDPARNTVENPITARTRLVQNRPGCTLLDHPDAVAIAEIFDATYEITLQMVARFFAFPDDKVLEGMAFGPLMTMAIRPLAEVLSEINASENSELKAGPPFQSAARDMLHPHRIAAWTVFGERLQQIALTCAQVQQNLQPEHKQAGERLTFISKNINFVALRLKTAVEYVKAGKPPLGSLSAGSGN
jgi:Ferritin-like